MGFAYIVPDFLLNILPDSPPPPPISLLAFPSPSALVGQVEVGSLQFRV